MKIFQGLCFFIGALALLFAAIVFLIWFSAEAWAFWQRKRSLLLPYQYYNLRKIEKTFAEIIADEKRLKELSLTQLSNWYLNSQAVERKGRYPKWITRRVWMAYNRLYAAKIHADDMEQ
jgi:hypothetical protein